MGAYYKFITQWLEPNVSLRLLYIKNHDDLYMCVVRGEIIGREEEKKL